MKVDDEFIFFFSEVSSLEIRPKVVYPPQSTALATSKQTYIRYKSAKSLRHNLCLSLSLSHLKPKPKTKQNSFSFSFLGEWNYQQLWEEISNSLHHEVWCSWWGAHLPLWSKLLCLCALSHNKEICPWWLLLGFY